MSAAVAAILQGLTKEQQRELRSYYTKKVQFSKIHVAIADAMVIFVWITWCYLQLKGMTPPSDLAMSIVTIYGASATTGYYVQNIIRETSLNKHKIHIPEPGTKRIMPDPNTTNTEI